MMGGEGGWGLRGRGWGWEGVGRMGGWLCRV